MKTAFFLAGMAGVLMVGTARGDEKMTFEFQDPATHATLLHGEETVHRDGPDIVKHTVYLWKNDPAQQEETRYDAESLRLATYRFEDKLSGEMASVTVKDGKAEVEYREDKDSKTDTDDIEWGSLALCGKALPDLILKGWSKLQAGSALDFDLYVPFRMETIGFHAVRKEASAGATRILVEPRNWMIRQFAPAIEFEFATTGAVPRLTSYLGPSMVRIGGESNRKVEILFK